MDFTTLLTNRRSIRDFQNKDVPLSIIREIIQDTRLAPTAGDDQPCKFIIIQNRNCIRKLSDESKKNLLSDLEQNPESSVKNYEPYLRDENFNVFYNAPSLVFIIGPTELHSLDVDCALTAAYFMFSATSRGLGTCWIGLGAHIRNRKILDDIGVPIDCQIAAPVIVGYPASMPPASERHCPDILKII
ncbi:MAG: nitroreductase family protein [Syntrophaceae bacterium]|nr:nitroreductase family protein [Syntrophaceae bacterium]